MEGVVKSFVAEKGFGFIDGHDGKSYFFHANSFTPKLDNQAVLDGALVSFDPTPTPKGLAAMRLSMVRNQAVEWVISDKFQLVKDVVPKRGQVIARTGIISESGDGDPDDVKSELVALARSLGANAILDLCYEKQTESNGNYQYTVHQFSGRPALIAERRLTSDLLLIEASERLCKSRAKLLRNRYQDYLEELARQRRGRLILNIVITILVVVGVIILKRRVG